MKVYLDECIDCRLARLILNHEVKSARQMGWTGLKNGELLALASAHFDAFITVDWNLAFQQNVPGLNIAIVVPKARSNRLPDLTALVPNLLTALDGPTAGGITIVENAAQ